MTTFSFWGAVRAIAGVCRSTSGPYLKLFNLYVCSIHLFVLFTQCLSFLRFVSVQVQKTNN